MTSASVFSRFFSARVRLSLPVVTLAAALVLPIRCLHADDSPGHKDTDFTSILSGETVYTVVYQFIPGTDANIPDNDLIFAGGDLTAALDLVEDGEQYAGFNPLTFGNEDTRIVYTAVKETKPTVLDAPEYLLIGGLFGKSIEQTKDDEPAANITRVLPNGAPDPNFNPGKGANDYVTAILPLTDGRMVVGGLFDAFNKETHNHLVRLESDGSIDETFASGLQINDDVLSIVAQLDPATGQPNGDILICGVFNSVSGQSQTKIARLDSGGNLDTSFHPVIDTRVIAMTVQSNGQIIIGGDFGNVNGTAVNRIARLNYDGSLDATFVGSVTGVAFGEVNPCAVYVLKPLGDGRVYVAGNFVEYNGVTRNYLARVLVDGTLDTTFDPGDAITNKVQTLDIQDDRKVLVGETLGRSVDGVIPPSLIRLFGDPAGLPIASIIASGPKAKEITKIPKFRKNGQFTISRTTGNVSGELTVFLDLSGSAVLHEDYRFARSGPLIPLNDTGLYRITIPAGSTAVTVKVRPKGVVQETSPTTVTLTLDPSATFTDHAYTIGAANSATVDIYND